MFFDFFRKPSGVVDMNVEGEKGKIEKKHKVIIGMIIVAILVLAFWDFDKEKEVTETEAIRVNGNLEEVSVSETEEKLKKMISTIKGAGKVNVMVVFEDKGERFPAADNTEEREIETQGETQTEKSIRQENIILFDDGTGEKPYVLREKIPVPKGVFVSATGAKDERVRLEIYETVKALYGISGHRIKVAPAEE